MSSYRGRTGPNFSEYLNNLNTVSPTTYDPASFGEELVDLNQDLSIFTNTDFTSMDDPQFNFDLSTDGKNDTIYDDYLASVGAPQPATNASPSDTAQFFSNYNTPIQPAPVPNFSTSEIVSPTISGASQPRTKVDGSASVVAPEEKSRLAAEEDKRRRNTAASARFRVKKKQREQALEKTVKEIQDKNSKLEARLAQIEMENRWLKELVTEKHGIQSKEEMAAAFNKYRKESEERDFKDSPDHTTGVGTK